MKIRKQKFLFRIPDKLLIPGGGSWQGYVLINPAQIVDVYQ